MNDLPAPLTPPECDLRDFPFLPLDVLRLRDSDISAIEDAEAFRAAVLSWCAAWHQVPAGSLPDDDAALCRLLGYGRDLKTWRRVREAGALRGYVKCSDGRLYHPVVAEKAIEAWSRKERQRDRGRKGNASRWGSHKDRTAIAQGSHKDAHDASHKDRKGQGQGQGEDRDKETPKSPASDDARDLKNFESPDEARPPGWQGQWNGLRANGTNPRAVANAVTETANALKRTEIRQNTEAHPLWATTRPWLTEADFRGFIAKCEFVEAASTGHPTLVAPTKFVRDHIRSQWGDRLRDARGFPVTIEQKSGATD